MQCQLPLPCVGGDEGKALRLWVLLVRGDKAHISTLVVAQRWRGRGLGELLLLALIDQAIAKNAALVTLEVRGSNKTAQALYTKYGLKVVGRRKLYYADNQEDALIMTVKLLGGGYQARLAQLQAALFARLAAGE